jgi:hypothetical protein
MSKSSVRRQNLRAILSAGLSLAALSIAAPANAADLPVKAVPAPLPGQTLLWLEGGAFWVPSDPIPFRTGFGALFGNGVDGNGGDGRVSPDRVGWDFAAGFDHRFVGTRWHVNAEGRYGQNKGQASGQESIFLAFPGVSFSAPISTQANLKEYHWQADAGVGYDIVTGPSSLQLKFGLRVAQISATTTVNTNLPGLFTDTGAGTTVPFNVSSTANVRRTFLGAGPRVGIDGSVPLVGGWTLDYKADGAWLFGNTKIDSDTTSSFSVVVPPIAIVAAGIPSSLLWSKQINVVNADVQAGIGYWITPYMKFAVSYRVDAFLDPLRAAPDDTLPARSIDRVYHGPKATLTARFN